MKISGKILTHTHITPQNSRLEDEFFLGRPLFSGGGFLFDCSLMQQVFVSVDVDFPLVLSVLSRHDVGDQMHLGNLVQKWRC